MREAPVLGSAADPASDTWRTNEEAHTELAARLREKLAAARLGGGERSRARHVARGKLLPATGSTPCSTPARPSWSWPRWRPTGCTAEAPRPPG